MVFMDIIFYKVSTIMWSLWKQNREETMVVATIIVVV